MKFITILDIIVILFTLIIIGINGNTENQTLSILISIYLLVIMNYIKGVSLK